MKNYDIAAFVWPSYTGDEPRTRIFWPDGIGEWQTVKAMIDKGYKGCRWPRIPLWGYENEADSLVMEKQIECAVSYGINVFIYDWYWYDNRPFLENCLNDGFLKAKNKDKMKFCLMWANHNATHLWDKRNSDNDLDTVIWNGVVTPEIFSNICDRTIEKYFLKENYYSIDGCPVYMIFDIDNFIRSFGTSDECKKAIDEFREKNQGKGRFWYFSTKADKRHSDVEYQDEDYLIFGKESAGLPEYLIFGNPEQAVRIPMRDELRSLNLSNSVAIAVYEALRQLDYPALR